MISKVLLVAAAFHIGLALPDYIYRKPTQYVPSKPSLCPPTFDRHPLILVSMDGFKPEYLSRGKTPTILALANRGVRSPYMKPSYPTATIPNHYTIATGMYPPAHGIVANKFYDPVFDAEFRIGSAPESFKKRYWGGEPIWKTAENQGLRAGTYYWPGSEVDGNQPSYWFRYNESIPFEDRVEQVLAWLDLPPAQRPQFLTLYMHEPDRTGHNFGPAAPEVDEMLTRVDSIIRLLVDGLEKRKLFSCTNLIILSDHGMSEAGQDKALFLDQYIPNLENRTRFWDGVFSRFTPNDGSQSTKNEMLNALSCKRQELRVYDKKDLPIRWHIGNQRRVEDIVVDLNPGFSAGGDKTFEADAGDHGYDYFFEDMNALFLAHGPSFHRNVEVEAFQNIELYNLMCQLLGVTPAPNNGTWGSLHHMLVNPPPYPITTQEFPPPVIAAPREEHIGYSSVKPLCEGDFDKDYDYLEVLKETEEELPKVFDAHLPFGVPSMGVVRNTVALLAQPNFITAYSPILKMPLWTSFTITQPSVGGRRFPWRSDLRLALSQRSSCVHYLQLLLQGYSQQPLFPPEFNCHEEVSQLPFLMSNAIPQTPRLTQRWQQLLYLVNSWVRKYGVINVLTGPVFDHDGDTFADNLYTVRNPSGGLALPTHKFLVVSRCIVWVQHMKYCPPAYVDALAFVYPQTTSVSNCLSSEQYARKYSASVQDVEKITGLRLFPSFSYKDQVRLRVRIHSNIWGRESWRNRLFSNVFGVLV
ncbi:venom phosphodiesterase 2-like [Penaeus indicus]|uniref:venom phosphodiesterase 2-like n=1 Tax=Penaeus indicus TaxID=29960 RepID=UPI00300D664A